MGQLEFKKSINDRIEKIQAANTKAEDQKKKFIKILVRMCVQTTTPERLKGNVKVWLQCMRAKLDSITYRDILNDIMLIIRSGLNVMEKIDHDVIDKPYISDVKENMVDFCKGDFKYKKLNLIIFSGEIITKLESDLLFKFLRAARKDSKGCRGDEEKSLMLLLLLFSSAKQMKSRNMNHEILKMVKRKSEIMSCFKTTVIELKPYRADFCKILLKQTLSGENLLGEVLHTPQQARLDSSDMFKGLGKFFSVKENSSRKLTAEGESLIKFIDENFKEDAVKIKKSTNFFGFK